MQIPWHSSLGHRGNGVRGSWSMDSCCCVRLQLLPHPKLFFSSSFGPSASCRCLCLILPLTGPASVWSCLCLPLGLPPWGPSHLHQLWHVSCAVSPRGLSWGSLSHVLTATGIRPHGPPQQTGIIYTCGQTHGTLAQGTHFPGFFDFLPCFPSSMTSFSQSMVFFFP